MSDLKPLMDQNFLEYASYVIKDRAIPHINDGLKPVQRRIMYTMMRMDDGKYHKVANIIGDTMKLHPHGDASIGDALVVLANKEFFVDKQGNFGNILTGDPASASRYIEARLTPLAKELFNNEITETESSYDGRMQEPITLPSKLPNILLLGTEGIAVGMSTTILPHNFIEVLNAQIAYLKKQPFELYPDFLSGGSMDVSNYQEGNGKVRVRAKVEVVDDKTLIIREVPYSVTTESLMNSIQDAANKGKLKISSVNNYTTEHVEIELKFPRGVNAEESIAPLYAFTQAEVSISGNFLVIQDNRPAKITTTHAVQHCTDQLVAILEAELHISLKKKQQSWHDRKLEQLFIQNRLYQLLESSNSYESMMTRVSDAMGAYASELQKPIEESDIERLLNIPIKRLSKFDVDKNLQTLKELETEIAEIQENLQRIKAYTVAYLRKLVKEYSKHYPRRTEITSFEEISLKEVTRSDMKVVWDAKEGYLGTAVKGDQLDVCSSYDRLVLFYPDGLYKIIRVPEKLFVGKDVMHVVKVQEGLVYNVAYYEDKNNICYAKRFKVESFIIDKEYRLFAQKPGAKIVHFSTGEDVCLKVHFHPAPRLRKLHELYHFNELAVKNISARGNRVSSKPIRRVKQVDASKEKDAQPLQMLLTDKL